jgi:hypothetical protein
LDISAGGWVIAEAVRGVCDGAVGGTALAILTLVSTSASLLDPEQLIRNKGKINNNI